MAHPQTFLYDGRHLAEGCRQNGFHVFPLLERHVYALETIKRPKDAPPHNDPFDRMLLAQAKSEGMKLLTHNSLIPNYNETCIISV